MRTIFRPDQETRGHAQRSCPRAPSRSDAPGRSPARQPRHSPLGAEQGDTLIEVLISAVLLAVIIVATLTGLDTTNRSTALQRARSQADAIAQQSEEQLRSEPIKRLYELEAKPETKTVTQGNTVYTVQNTAAYFQDATATSSCTSSSTSSSTKADYLRTASKVTWPSLGPGKAVIETGIISPPAGAALIVQTTESGSAAVAGATVTATGPAPETTAHSLETSTNGCAILALAPGEYTFDVTKAGYVTPNGYEHTSQDEGSSVTHSAYIAAETTAKEGYYLARPGSISVTFSGGENDTFVAFNTGMNKYKTFGATGTYATTVSSPTKLYPFPTKYTVYAGSCEADKPALIKSENEVSVPTTGAGSTTLALPPIKLAVYSGKSSVSPGTLVTGASGSLTDEGCGNARTFVTSSGAIPKPGSPYGNYSLCVTALVGSPAKQHRYLKTGLHNLTSAGVAETIYLEAAPESALTTCP
jgi:Tfp pilus assembly protein PilV